MNGPSVTDLLDGVQSSLFAQISDALPIAGGILGVVAGIYIGVKIFKRLTGART